jgi:hypothetical protein
MPLSKDPEVFPSEGYLIKTRGGNNVSTTVPESYFYAKFSIASGRNKMTLKTRNFSGTNATFFKVTAIRMDGTLMHLAPASNTAQFAEAAADGCWKFIHEAGGKGDPEGYGEFFSQPVLVTTEEVYPIPNYGSAMTPFYTILAIWVGGTILVALIKVKAEPKNLKNVKSYQLLPRM